MADSFQSNQALHPSSTIRQHSSSYSQLPRHSEENHTLWCLIQGDRESFKVTPPSYIDIDDLKQLIHAKGIGPTVPPKNLILWKVWAMSEQS